MKSPNKKKPCRQVLGAIGIYSNSYNIKPMPKTRKELLMPAEQDKTNEEIAADIVFDDDIEKETRFGGERYDKIDRDYLASIIVKALQAKDSTHSAQLKVAKEALEKIASDEFGLGKLWSTSSQMRQELAKATLTQLNGEGKV